MTTGPAMLVPRPPWWRRFTPATPPWPWPSGTRWAPPPGSRCGRRSTPGAALTAVDDVLSALDLQASRFREDSEISLASTGPAAEPVHLSDGLAEAVGVALAAARWTGGLVRPDDRQRAHLAGLRPGFRRHRSRCRRPAGTRCPAAPVGPARTGLAFSRPRRDPLLTLPAGVLLDLGATAKGLGSGRAAAAACQRRHRATGGVLVSLGGDIAVAGNAGRGGWPIASRRHRQPSQQPWPGRPGQLVRLASGGGGDLLGDLPPVAPGGRLMHHIVDPADRPARGRALAVRSA